MRFARKTAFVIGFLFVSGSASAQDWTTRVAVGVGGPTGAKPVATPDGSKLKVDSGMALVFDVAKRIGARPVDPDEAGSMRTEIQVGLGIVNYPMNVVGSTLDLSGFRTSEVHAGLVYRWRRNRVEYYGGPVVVGITRDVAVLPSNPAISVSEPGGWGGGAQGGLRVCICASRGLALDVSGRWSQLRLPALDGQRLDLNSWLVLVGFSIRR